MFESFVLFYFLFLSHILFVASVYIFLKKKNVKVQRNNWITLKKDVFRCSLVTVAIEFERNKYRNRSTCGRVFCECKGDVNWIFGFWPELITFGIHYLTDQRFYFHYSHASSLSHPSKRYVEFTTEMTISSTEDRIKFMFYMCLSSSQPYSFYQHLTLTFWSICCQSPSISPFNSVDPLIHLFHLKCLPSNKLSCVKF